MNSASFCICNLDEHDRMNQKWTELRCLPQITDKPIAPRPQKVSPCGGSHSVYHAPETLSSLKQTTVCEQLSDLKHIESQLHGRQRQADHVYVPYAGSRVRKHSVLWEQHDISNHAQGHAVVDLRVPTSPPSARCNATASSPTQNPNGYRSQHTAQNRSPWMADAPKYDSVWKDETHPLHWNGQMPCNNTEVWKWNDHPYLLDVGVGVTRRNTRVPLPVVPMQDVFMNNTRRKMNLA